MEQEKAYQPEINVNTPLPEGKSDLSEITLGEVLQSDEFKTILQGIISSRNFRVPPGEGLRYKRDVIDNLKDEGLWNVERMTTEYILSLDRKSTIRPSYRRAIIKLVEGAVTRAYFKIVNNQKEEEVSNE